MYKPDFFSGTMAGFCVLMISLMIGSFIMMSKAKAKSKEQGKNVSVGCGTPFIICIIISVIAGIGTSYFIFGESLKEGNYADYNCIVCDKPASYKYKNGLLSTIDYYCADHYGMAKAAMFGSKNIGANKDNNTIECKVCGRKFLKDSDNGKSIKRNNMCSNCYNNYKNATDYLREQPVK